MSEQGPATDGRPSPGGALHQRMAQARLQEQRDALRALLARPLIRAAGDDADLHMLVRRHAAALRDWLDHNTGWRLHVDGDLARLHKTPADAADATRSAADARTREPFRRRRYVVLCLCLAALHEAERQTALGRLAGRVAELAAADEAIVAADCALDLAQREHRRDLVQAVRLLIDVGVLVRVDGDEERFVSQQGDVLYNIDRSLLTAMPSFRRGPSTITEEDFELRLQQLLSEPEPQTDEARTRRLRWSITRRLLDDPIVYYDELPAAEREYLLHQRGRLVRELEAATGLIAEVRAEGVALVDVGRGLTDLDMPEEGTDGHATLLAAQWLADRLREHRAQPARAAVSMPQIEAHVRELIRQHRHERAHWKKGVEAPGYERVMASQIIDRLEALRLVRRRGEAIEPRAAIARYALDEPIEPEPGTPSAAEPEQTLWTSDS